MKKLPPIYQKKKDEDDNIRRLFEKTRQGPRKVQSEVVGQEAKQLYFNNFRKIHKIKQNIRKPSHMSASIALLQRIDQEKLNPLTLGIVKRKGREEHVKLNFGLSDRYAGAFSKGLQQIKSLEKIELKGNRLSQRGSLSVLNGLSSPSLKSINLCGNRIGYQGILRLVELLKAPSCSIKSITLEGGSISEQGAVQICEALKRNHTVQYLNIAKNSLRDTAGTAIGEMLEANSHLKSLDMHWNLLSQDGAKALFEGLEASRSLTQLDLSWNGLGTNHSVMISAMADCLAKNTVLQHLDISFNWLDADCCAAIGTALCNNRTLLGLHVLGNACNVDMLGFLEIAEIVHTRLTPYSYRRILSNEKNRPGENCWICEQWKDATIRFPFKMDPPLYVHLSADDFKPMQMQESDDGFISFRALPEGELDFFFSDLRGNVMVLDKYKKKKFHVEAFEVEYFDGCKVKLEAWEVNSLQVERKNGLKICKPRTPFEKYVPKEIEKVKDPWDFNKSLFKNYVLDTEELLTKCFEFDWEHSKIPNLFKDEKDLNECKTMLREKYRSFKNFYKMISTYNFGEYFSVSTNTIFDILSQLSVFGPLYGASDFGVNWKAAIIQKVKKQLYNPGNALVRYEFLEMFVRIAYDKYFRTKQTSTVAEAVSLLLEEFQDILETATFNDFRERYFTEEVENFIKDYKRLLTNVYTKYSGRKTLPGKKKFISLDEFRDMAIALGCCVDGSTTREVDQAYCFAMMTQVNELFCKRHVEMFDLEFYEALARLSDSVCKFDIPIHEKLKTLLPQLIALTSRNSVLKTGDLSKLTESLNSSIV